MYIVVVLGCFSPPVHPGPLEDYDRLSVLIRIANVVYPRRPPVTGEVSRGARGIEHTKPFGQRNENIGQLIAV